MGSNGAGPIFRNRLLEMSAMQATPLIESLIPHRRRMRLIDTIVTVAPDRAMTRATVGTDWPLTTADGADPIVLIELAAQTAGVCLGWTETQKPEAQRGQSGGWLVGIKRASFSIGRIPEKTCITVQSETRTSVDQYMEITATASIDEIPIGEIHLQVLQAGKSAFSGVAG